METKKELKKKKERRNKIAIISLLIFLCFTISNAQEHCDFEDFIKNEFPAKEKNFMEGKLNLRNINIGFIFFKPIRYLGFIDSKIKRRMDVKFLKISKSEINDSIYLAKGKNYSRKEYKTF